MAHGSDRDPDAALRVAIAAMGASVGLDRERSTLYLDLVVASLSAAARKALQEMDPAKYEYQSEFARRYIALGKAEGRAEGEARGEAKGKIEGKAEGKAELLQRLLTRRFGPLPAGVRDRLVAASAEQLDDWAERFVDAARLADVFVED
jgi:flagellar biosynthesis/type III secretory pathway protein FliH